MMGCVQSKANNVKSVWEIVIFVFVIMISSSTLTFADESSSRDVNLEKLQDKNPIEPRQRIIAQSETDTYSINVQDISLVRLIALLAEKSGKNILLQPGLDQKISIVLNQLSLEEILDTLLLYGDLYRTEVNGVIYITDAKTHYRLTKGDIRTEVITLNFADAQEILSALENHQFDGGIERNNIRSLSIDTRLNQIVVTEQQAEIDKIRQVVAKLDHPAKQVEISAYIVAAFDDFAKELGVNWGVDYAKGAYSIGGAIPDGDGTSNFNHGIGNLTSLGVVKPNFSLGYMVLGRGLHLGLELSAMQSEGRGEIISNPVVLTTSRKAAYIKQGTEVAYSTSSNDGTNTQFKEAVMELNVKPHITPTNHIMIDIFISKDEIGGYSQKGEPIIAKKELRTQANVKHGETIILGGIYEYENSTTMEEVPFLSQLPLLGALFKKESNRRRKAELLIFITPKIVDTLL